MFRRGLRLPSFPGRGRMKNGEIFPIVGWRHRGSGRMRSVTALALIVVSELVAHGSTERSCPCPAFQAPQICGGVGSRMDSSLRDGRLSRSSAYRRANAGRVPMRALFGGQGRSDPNKPKLPSRGGEDRLSNNGLEGKGGQGSKEDEDRQEFILNRGKALDTILHDYPNIFMHAPDFSVYRDDISLTDSAGFSASGITPYKMFFSALRTIVPMIYHRAIVSVHVMNKYDHNEGEIRVRWKAELYREGPEESKEEQELHRKNEGLRRLGFKVSCDHVPPSDSKGDKLVEGISVYKLDEKGRIYCHWIETLSPASMGEEYAKLQLAVPGLVSQGGGSRDTYTPSKKSRIP